MRRWLVALGASLGLAVGFGPIFINSFGLFQKPIIAELGWSRAQVSLGFTFATLVTAGLNGPVGALIDRRGVRPVVLAGVLILPTVLVLLSQVHAYAVSLIVAASMGLVGATTSYPGYMPLLPPWFDRRLGLAFSIAAAGVGYGTVVASPLIERLIASFGWRRALLILASGVLALGLANALILVRDKPRPDGPRDSEAAKAKRRALFRKAVSGSAFWRLTLAFALVPLVSIGVSFHVAALLTDRGFSPQQAAGALAISALAVLAARLGTGVLLDYLSPRLVGVVLFGGQAAGVLLLMSGFSGPIPYIALCLTGFATGGEGDLAPFVLSRRYGKPAYGRIYGLSFTFFNIGTAIGPFLMGWGFDAFGGYGPMLGVLAALAACAAALVFFSAGGREPEVDEALHVIAEGQAIEG